MRTTCSQACSSAAADVAGLGLAIAREVTHAQGGTLTADNRAEGGARFSLRLTLPRAAPPSLADVPRELPPFRALVADDNAVNRRVARVLLERLGATVFDVADGAQALDAAGHSRFDVIFLDLQMPVMDGPTAARKLRERDVKTPIVAMTASAGPTVEAECVAAGMTGCLFKPITLSALRQVVSEQVKPPHAVQTLLSTG